MSRYLTPSRVALLALIRLYSDGLIPSSASIPILAFVISYILPLRLKSGQHEDIIPLDAFTVSIEKLQEATVIHHSAIPGRTVWDLLLKDLWGISSLDALHAFFDDLPLLLERSIDGSSGQQDEVDSTRPKRMLLSRNSPFGAFVRRSQLEFTRLQFHDGTNLWKKFIVYRGPTLAFWKRRNPGAGSHSFDCNLQHYPVDADGRLVGVVYGDLSHNIRQNANHSTDDMERLLDHQVDRMQQIGVRIPHAVLSQIQTMAKSGSVVPEVSYYMQFLEAWKAGDYSSSFDNLHRYFDYTMQSGARGLYQYALLNLAILHADFGCFSEAITAMQETIATARENHDMPCLNYSLSWLHQFGRKHPEEMTRIQKRGVLGSEKEALSFLKAKAKETNMWPLLSKTLLSEAKFILSNGDSVSQAFESIVKAAHLNITQNTAESYGSQWLMQSSIFDRLGVSCQAWVYTELFLECDARSSPLEDVLQSQCKSAHILARRGRYDEATSQMHQVNPETLRALKHQQYWITNLGIMKLLRHLHRGELDAGEHVLAQLHAAPAGVQELQFNLSLMEVELQVRRGDYPNALTLLGKLLTRMDQQETDIFQRLKTMTLKARIYDKAGIPQKGFSVALRAASLAYNAQLLPLLWEAVAAVCRILVSVREFDAAVKLVESVMPQALECEDCELAASLFSCLADGHMGMAGQARAGTLQRKERLTKTSESLDRAFDEYSRIEDIKGQCEMMAKKATTMHLNGDPVLANDWAAKYLDIKRAARERS